MFFLTFLSQFIPEFPPYEGARFATKQMGGIATTAKRFRESQFLQIPDRKRNSIALALLFWSQHNGDDEATFFRKNKKSF